MTRLRVTVNLAKCQGYKRCAAVAPAVFGITADGKATVLHQEGAAQDEIMKAARACPYRAIAVTAQDSGEQLFPLVPKKAPSSP